LATPSRARQVIECFELTGTAPILHHHSMDPSEPGSNLEIYVSCFLDREFYTSNVIDQLQNTSLVLDQSSSPRGSGQGRGVVPEDRRQETVLLSGFPGEDSSWRFLTENVVASLLHRNFGVRTSANAVQLSQDRRYCQVQLSTMDAMHLKKCIADRENTVAVYHRDRRVGSLTLDLAEGIFGGEFAGDENLALLKGMTLNDFDIPSSQVMGPLLNQGEKYWRQLNHYEFQHENDGSFVGSSKSVSSQEGFSSNQFGYEGDTWHFDRLKASLNTDPSPTPPPSRAVSSSDLQYPHQQYQLPPPPPPPQYRPSERQHYQQFRKQLEPVDRVLGDAVPREQSVVDDGGMFNFQFDSSDSLFVNDK
jgi:hypothetical protein